MNRPITTLFLLMSVDGKISTGLVKSRDFDKDLPNIPSTAKGLHQYYEIERQSDPWCLCTGKTLAKIGINNTDYKVVPVGANIVVPDNSHLERQGFINLSKKYDKVLIYTQDKTRESLVSDIQNLQVYSDSSSNLKKFMWALKEDYGIDRITIQSGGGMNARFFDEHLIDFVDIVVAPVIIGGDKTPTLVDGVPKMFGTDLSDVGELEFIECNILDNSYLRLMYRVTNADVF